MVVGGVIFAALMPHAPILIPGVGGDELLKAASSVAGLKAGATRLVGTRPRGVIVISPHSPRRPGAFGVWSGSRLHGSFSRFGAPDVGVELSNDIALTAEIERRAHGCGLQTWQIRGQPLDHGALVPLWYLVAAGWNGPITVLGLNYPGEGRLTELGRVIAHAATRLESGVALVASGDMSHRLTPNAPGGYEPRASEFDQKFIASLRGGFYHDVQRIDPVLQELAGEDVVDSTIVALAATNWSSAGHEVLSYEGPFGVGYGVAVLFNAKGPVAEDQEHLLAERSRQVWANVLPRVARESVKAALRETGTYAPLPEEDALTVRRAVFVTILNASGKLRGCAGTLAPKHPNIIEETRHAARAAAFSDRRFPSVIQEELPGLHFEVNVLEPLEDVTLETELNPEHYGVVVSTSDGRQGCLLPGIPEIRTVQQQLDIARRKGGILGAEAVRLQRFKAARFEETEAIQSAACLSNTIMELHHQGGWWTMQGDGRIECQVCPRLCKLREGQRGFCFVRQRVHDRLMLTTYGRSSGFCVDPMEKKPLNHFYPGTSVLSFGTAGCNLGCRFCQNWDISKARESNRLADAASPETIARRAKELGCQAVAFTYNDPVIFVEYALDVAVACHQLGVQTVAVTAGYMKAEPRAEFYKHIDAANVDLKGFTEAFYHKLCFGQLGPVLETLEYLHRETQVWLEVTSLLIPGENDDDKQLHWAAEWFVEHLGPDVPWHFTAFHPDYKMLDKPSTSLATLDKARTIALSKGLRYVYTGNIRNPGGSSTRCPQCHRMLIERDGYEIGAWRLKAGSCEFCGCAIPGRFQEHPGHWGSRRMPVTLN